ncbi:MAG: MaoC family dehydratase [Candidatus Lernaella stagnicola]|nr:MaoC family dehydratase [Candidatus Lernaella stagnicola]
MKKLGDVNVGDTFGLKHTVGKYDPIFYAGASGDFNLIHIDPEFGKMVGLGGSILQGLCTMAFTARAHTDWAGDPYALRRIKVRFSSPVRPDDTVEVKAEVTEVVDGVAKTRFNAVNQAGEEVITMAEADIVLAGD